MEKIKVTTSKAISFVGAAINQGQNLQGVEEGPKALRQSGLFGALKNKFNANVIDYGDISLQEYLKIQDFKTIDKSKYQHHVNNLHIIDPLLNSINTLCAKALSEHPQNILLTVGGDHSVATGSIHALLGKYQNLKVIWVDAHPDFINSNQNKYPGYHGMPLSHLSGVHSLPGFEWLKHKIPFQNIVLIGIRDIDPDEWINLKKYKIKCFTPDHIDKYGIGGVMTQAIEYLDPNNTYPFHISFDIDAMDPSIASGTGTKFRGGLTYREGVHIIRRVSHERNLVGLDLVQINQKLETSKKKIKFRGQQEIGDVDETVGLGIQLVRSIFQQYLTL